MTPLRTTNARHALRLPLSGALAFLAILFFNSVSHAQNQTDDSRVPPSVPTISIPGNSTDTNPSEPDEEDPRNDLGAPQIIAMAQQNPAVIVELKSMVAEWMQAKGITLQAEAITDEQFFSQVASSRDLRAKITHFLQARGLILEKRDERISNDAPDANKMRVHQQAGKNTEDSVPAQRPGNEDEANAEWAHESLNGASRTEEHPLTSRTRTEDSRREQQAPPSITEEPKELHQTAPYNLRSLRDLYTQIPDSPEHLRRFGSEMFTQRESLTGDGIPNSKEASNPLDVPLGPEYVLGPGDELSISLWGGVSETFTRTINSEGAVTLPEAGQIQLAGITLGKAQAVVEGALQPQFRNAHVAVTLARLRAIRIYVVGDVQRPGAYDISSLASPLSALFAAGGPTAVGSLRVMRHLRNGKLIGAVDLYDFLLRGIRNTDDRLQGGDTLLIPPAGSQVAIFGAVKRPAIYELLNEKTLASGLEDAGGLTVAAELGHVTIERIAANQRREVIHVEGGGTNGKGTTAATFADVDLKDGDRVSVGAVLPYSEQVVYLQGHVARPGKLAYRDGLRLADVLQSYRDLLPEPAERGEIVRLVAPDLHPETMDFNLPDVMVGNSNPGLRPFDTIRIFGRYERDSPTVTIQGEVQRPGPYPMFQGMSAALLVRAAGGFKRGASLDDADLISYSVENNSAVTIERRTLQIGAAVLKNDPQSDATLQPGDVLTIHQMTGWNDIGASVLIQGEVAHPGSYGFKEGEHLSDVLRRAGGFRATAYPEGAVLTRPEVRLLEEKSREELIRQIETSSAAARLSPGIAGNDQSATLQLIQQQQDQVLSQLRNQPASGRLVIHIDPSIDSWAGTSADIEVRGGDVLKIPKRPEFVLISGQVYNASATTFVPGKTARWYLEHAGGATGIANRKEIFIIRANGSVVGRRSAGWLDHDVLSTTLERGDVIVVPQKIVGTSVVWRNILGAAQVVASLGIAAAVAGY